MRYKIIGMKAVTFVTDFEKASDELSMLVNAAISEGWKPQGGVCVGVTQSTHAPYLFQAVVKD